MNVHNYYNHQALVSSYNLIGCNTYSEAMSGHEIDLVLKIQKHTEKTLKINKWAFQWKMSLNLDPKKQAQEVIFSRKLNKPNHITHH